MKHGQSPVRVAPSTQGTYLPTTLLTVTSDVDNVERDGPEGLQNGITRTRRRIASVFVFATIHPTQPAALYTTMPALLYTLTPPLALESHHLPQPTPSRASTSPGPSAGILSQYSPQSVFCHTPDPPASPPGYLFSPWSLSSAN